MAAGKRIFLRAITPPDASLWCNIVVYLRRAGLCGGCSERQPEWWGATASPLIVPIRRTYVDAFPGSTAAGDSLAPFYFNSYFRQFLIPLVAVYVPLLLLLLSVQQ